MCSLTRTWNIWTHKLSYTAKTNCTSEIITTSNNTNRTLYMMTFLGNTKTKLADNYRHMIAALYRNTVWEASLDATLKKRTTQSTQLWEIVISIRTIHLLTWSFFIISHILDLKLIVIQVHTIILLCYLYLYSN